MSTISSIATAAQVRPTVIACESQADFSVLTRVPLAAHYVLINASEIVEQSYRSAIHFFKRLLVQEIPWS